jgi:hypothetical protein
MINIGLISQERTISLETKWKEVSGRAKRGLKLDKAEQECLDRSSVARYIAALPYAADCKDPDRMALILLSLYVIDLRGGSPFDIRASDQDGSLSWIAPYFAPLYEVGGDPEILEKAKLILGMKVFSHWIEEPGDNLTGVDFRTARERLKLKAERLPANELLDGILSVEDGMVNSWFVS